MSPKQKIWKEEKANIRYDIVVHNESTAYRPQNANELHRYYELVYYLSLFLPPSPERISSQLL